MKPIRWLTNYFDLNRGERSGIVALTFLILLLIVIQIVVRKINFLPQQDFSEVAVVAEQLRVNLELEESKLSTFSYTEQLSVLELENPAERTLQPFLFNPNTATEGQLLQLGLQPRVAKSIQNYKKAGGKFIYKEDLKRIYNLPPEDYEILEPFIKLPTKPTTVTENKNFERFPMPKKPENVIVELNAADSATLTTISGIGPAFASRIMKYKNNLGGFVSENQLLEVYGLDSVRLQQILPQIKINESQIEKININTADYQKLVRHPYINSKIANTILNYKKQHGNYKNVNEIRKIVLINEDLYEKLSPYLTVD